MDENEREIVPEEALPEDAIQEEELQEEVPAEQSPEDETQDGGEDEEDEEDDDDDEDRPEKPIRGPGVWAWCVAVAAMLFALVMLIPSMWYTGLGLTAARGLLNEAANNCQSALTAYEFLHNTDLRTDGFWIGLTSGEFPFERQYAILGKLNGPLLMQQSNELPRPADIFPRLPRSLRKLSARSDHTSVLNVRRPVWKRRIYPRKVRR